MNIRENVNLKALNTFGFQVNARYFAEVNSVEALREAVLFAQDKELDCIPVGGGSNLVLTGDLDALVIHVNLKGREVLARSGEQVLVKASAGENWHEFVRWTLAEEAYGLENLSLIPGNVGAAPIQNIGAYGVEIKDYFLSLEALELATGELRTFSLEDCDFGYRDSVFKQASRDQFIILSVTFSLDTQLQPRLEYGKLQEEVFKRMTSSLPTGFEISESVADIRMEKLPDPAVLGNAGSFFKNPVVSSETVDRLRDQFPNLVAFPFGDDWKLAAGWLIDQSGLKGYRQGAVGTYKHQALVLVNHGGGEPRELVALAEYIQGKVFEKFGVQLEVEPRFY